MTTFKASQWNGYNSLKPQADVRGFQILVGTPREFPQSTFKVIHSRSGINLNLEMPIRNEKVAKSACRFLLLGKALDWFRSGNIKESLKTEPDFWHGYGEFVKQRMKKQDPKTWNAFYD